MPGTSHSQRTIIHAELASQVRGIGKAPKFVRDDLPGVLNELGLNALDLKFLGVAGTYEVKFMAPAGTTDKSLHQTSCILSDLLAARLPDQKILNPYLAKLIKSRHGGTAQAKQEFVKLINASYIDNLGITFKESDGCEYVVLNAPYRLGYRELSDICHRLGERLERLRAHQFVIPGQHLSLVRTA